MDFYLNTATITKAISDYKNRYNILIDIFNLNRKSVL